MINHNSILSKSLVVGIIIIFIYVTSVSTSAFTINDSRCTDYVSIFTPFTNRRINDNTIEDNGYIPNNLKQPFREIDPRENHKNVKDLKGNSWVFYPTDDTFIKKLSPNKNFGSLNLFIVGTFFGGENVQDPLLKFNISSITTDKNVFAKLYFYYFDYDYGSTRNISIYRVTSEWDEDIVTWNNQPSYVSTSTDVLNIPKESGVWLEFDVTEDVRGFIEGKYSNNGWLISYEYDDPYYRGDAWFYSKENGNLIPYLVVKEPVTLYVDDDNTEGPWDGSKEHPFQTITASMKHCFCGDTIFVFNGTYLESVTVREEYISLIGESKKDTFIISDSRMWAVLVRERSYGVTITGFTISTDSDNDDGYAGVAIDLYSYGNYVTDNIFVDNIVGVLLWTETCNNYILNNTISDDNYIGIYLLLCNKYNIISDNTIRNAVDYGILLEAQPSYNNICCNNISNTEVGIYLRYSFHINYIENNLLKNNDWGIYVYYKVEDISITGNIISGNKYGIALYDRIFNGNISRNVIDGNSCGLFYSEGYWSISNNIYIYENNFTNNKLKGGISVVCAQNCEIFCNNFIDNKINAKFKTIFGYRTLWYNNYWDNLKGSFYWIFGRIGIDCSLFFLFPWFQFDWHPALKPYDIEV